MTDLQTYKSFEETIRKKLKNDIGELMPESVLQKMVESSVHQIFFEEKTDRNDNSSGSWFQKEVKRNIEPILKHMVEVYFRKNKGDLQKMVHSLIDENKLSLIMMGIVSNQIRDDVSFAIQDISCLLYTSPSPRDRG